MDGEHPFSSPDTVPFPQTRHICAIIILSRLACSLQNSSAVRGRVSQHFVEISFRGHALGNNERDVELRIYRVSCVHCFQLLVSIPNSPVFNVQRNAAIKNKSSNPFMDSNPWSTTSWVSDSGKLLNTSYCKNGDYMKILLTSYFM